MDQQQNTKLHHIVQQHPKVCVCVGGGKKSDSIVLLWSKQGKQAKAHEQTCCLSLPLTLPPPTGLANHISVARHMSRE